jgi:hypothetical protein
LIKPNQRPLFAAAVYSGRLIQRLWSFIFIEFCASACGLLANVELGADAEFERRAMVGRFFLRTPYRQPDCQEFR